MADPTDVETEEEAPKKNWRRELEDKAAAAEARASDLEKRLAVAEAGLTNLTPKQLKALFAAHEGEVVSASLKETAAELGFGVQAQAEQEQPAPAGQEAAQVDPSIAAEAKELAALSNSPAQHSVSESGPMSQDRFDAKIRELADEPAKLDAFLRENLNLLQYGQTPD